MITLNIILWDHLTSQLPATSSSLNEETIFLFIESHEQATYVKHHKKKLVFLFSAMRHFADQLKEKGAKIDYHTIDKKPQSIESIIKSKIKQHKPDRIEITEPGEYWLFQQIKELKAKLPEDIIIHEDKRFIATHDDFKHWASGKTSLTMEFFYREMRKKTGLLLDKNKNPIGKKWNFDKENRKSLPQGTKIPPLPNFKPSKTVHTVSKTIEKQFSNHFGDIEPFHYGVTHEDAKKCLQHFIKHKLPSFGDYQDAMAEGEPFLFHSILSHYLNCGLLSPLDVCQQAEDAYHSGHAPLNAVEGFIRQIIGWREFIRGIYWHFMPKYKEMNALKAKTPLPDFFWGKQTKMNCISEVIKMTKEHAYSHHIQRLMVTGNFALLAGLDPKAVCEWYHIVYADAHEWVELPNTLGMVLYGDGGIVATKPYIASGAYINRMSNFCKNCHYNVKERTGEKACPFNFLYWDFLMRHEKEFRSNRRMTFSYKNLDRFSTKEQESIRKQAKDFIKKL